MKYVFNVQQAKIDNLNGTWEMKNEYFSSFLNCFLKTRVVAQFFIFCSTKFDICI